MHKRTSGFFADARWLLPAAALSLFGCPKQELAPLAPCTVSAVNERVDQTGVDQVDLLFMIDNSGSMASEQERLGPQLEKLVQVLTLGDRKPGEPAEERENNPRYFTPVRSLHVGVVTSNMGGIDNPATPVSQSIAVNSCKGLGDDAKLQTSTTIAREGVVAMTDKEFESAGYAKDDVVLPPDENCPSASQPKYQTFTAGEKPDAATVANNFRCVARVGVRGCPSEQQLEAVWKALAPAEAPSDAKDKDLYKFLNNTGGQGTRFNDGFLRPDAILAVMIVTDEEDCSLDATNPEAKLLFDDSQQSTAEANVRFGGAQMYNMRCGTYGEAEGFLWSPERYVKGLKSLKPGFEDRVIFGAIVGIPQTLNDAQLADIDGILARKDMEFRPNPDKRGLLPIPSCIRPNDENPARSDEAFPPRRILQVAKGFRDNAVIHSICADDYAPALDKLIERIARQLKGNCLPRQLRPNVEGFVECQVYELLPPSESKCSADYGHFDESGKVYTPEEREIRENGKVTRRKACKMNQVPVLNGKPGSKAGWYYDNVSAELKDCPPGEQQRIAFTFRDLPSGAGATFECFQSVARIDVKAKGVEAVNTRCFSEDAPADDQCPSRSDEEYKMICIEESVTCQIECANDPDCPPGWVCAKAGGGNVGKPFCQQPTCQTSGGGGSSAED